MFSPQFAPNFYVKITVPQRLYWIKTEPDCCCSVCSWFSYFMAMFSMPLVQYLW